MRHNICRFSIQVKNMKCKFKICIISELFTLIIDFDVASKTITFSYNIQEPITQEQSYKNSTAR